MNALTYKTCNCCGFKTFNMRKRVCPQCGVPAIWAKAEETAKEVADREALDAKMEKFLAEMLAA